MASVWAKHANSIAGWSINVALLIVALASNLIKPRNEYVAFRDLYKYSYPHRSNTVPSWSVLLFALVGSLVVLVVLIFMEGYWELSQRGQKRSFKDILGFKRVAMHKAILALLFSLAMTGALTNVAKNLISRKRPDFVSRCWPDGKIEFEGVVKYPAVYDMNGGYPKCNGPSKEVDEGMRSFPSGHSSLSMAGLGMIGWELLKTLHAGHPGVHIWRPCLGIVPFFLAVLVAISRVRDHWHHWQDVTVGLLLGFVVSYVAFWIWFPAYANEIRGAAFKRRSSPPDVDSEMQPVSQPGLQGTMSSSVQSVLRGASQSTTRDSPV